MLNEKDLKLEITHDKLIDILMHAATREDIAKLDNKIERLDDKIENLNQKVDNKIESLNQKIDEKIDKIDTKYDRLLWGIIASILGPIILRFIH